MSKEDEIIELYDPVKNMAKISSVVSSVENIKRIACLLKNSGKKKDDNLSDSLGTSLNKGVTDDMKVNFTGLHTDIAFVSTAKDGIDRKTLEAIDDNILKRNVLESFDDAVSDGYLTCKDDKYFLTQKGSEHINSPAFIKQFEKDQEYLLANSENRAMFEFKGEPQDIDIFRYTDSFDLNNLNISEQTKTVDRVTSYFNKLEETGFVNIDKNRVVTPTEKALNYLSKHPRKNFDVKPVTQKNLNEIVNTVSTATKSPSKVAVVVKVAKVAFQKLQQEQSQNNTHSNSRH